jgi:hypothetical protein
VSGARRLSQAISEGGGISVLVEIGDGAGAQAAEQQGAEGIVARLHVDGIREASALPLLWTGPLEHADDVDAVVIDGNSLGDRLESVIAEADEHGLECVIRVRDEDELAEMLERVDPEILLLSAEQADDGQEHLERLLELLPGVPAGKLAIAELASASRDEVLELERAGVDAVLVSGGDVGLHVGDVLPEQ